jgi:hypothetical protein
MADVPDFYIDGARIVYGVAGFALVLTRTRLTGLDGEPATPEEVAVVRMSLPVADQIQNLLATSIQNLAKQLDEQEKAAQEGAQAAPERAATSSEQVEPAQPPQADSPAADAPS